jgi:hypothetical protein
MEQIIEKIPGAALSGAFPAVDKIPFGIVEFYEFLNRDGVDDPYRSQPGKLGSLVFEGTETTGLNLDNLPLIGSSIADIFPQGNFRFSP